MSLHEQSLGATDEWYTPAYIFRAMGIDWNHGQVFDMDVASPGREITPWIPALSFITEHSLTRPWTGFIWMNAPFGSRNGLVPWLDKFIDHGNGVALVPDRTSAPWWRHSAGRMHKLLFVSPKIEARGTKRPADRLSPRKGHASWPLVQPLRHSARGGPS